MRQGHSGGQLLAHYRNRQGGLGQQHLAIRVDCSRSQIAQIERGTRLPSSHLLSALSRELGLGAVERALLFSLYGRVEPGQESLLPYVIAVLCLDSRLQADQAEVLIRLVVQEYQEALQQAKEGR